MFDMNEDDAEEFASGASLTYRIYSAYFLAGFSEEQAFALVALQVQESIRAAHAARPSKGVPNA